MSAAIARTAAMDAPRTRTHLVEVVEPPSLRAELARLGSELVARYGGGAAPPYGGGAAPPDGADPARDETGRRSVTAEPG